jgi:hypothetical protein
LIAWKIFDKDVPPLKRSRSGQVLAIRGLGEQFSTLGRGI